MRIVALSDTHMSQVKVPDGDVLVHAGDLAWMGTVGEVQGALDWLLSLPHKRKILVPGNHDRLFQDCPSLARSMTQDITVLIDESTKIDGKLFYGSPWTPEFMNWSFMLSGDQLQRRWECMPSHGIDVLVTHGPPFGVLDGVPESEYVTRRRGDHALGDRIDRVKPLVHIFGHIHPGHGSVENPSTRFYNVAICDDAYRPVHEPTIIDLE